LDNLGLVLVELHGAVRPTNIDGIESKAAPEYPLGKRMPSQAEARLKILPVPIVEPGGGVNHGAHNPGQWIDGGGAELALLAMRGVERAFGRPAQSHVESQVLRKLPVVLEIQAIDRKR